MAKMAKMIFLSLLVMAVRIRAQVVRDTDNNPVTSFERYLLIDKVAWEERGERLGTSHAPQTSAACCPRVAVVPDEESSSYNPVPVTLSPNRGNINSEVFEKDGVSITYEMRRWPCRDENPTIWTVGHEMPIQDFDIRFGGEPRKILTTFEIHSEGGGYIIGHFNPFTGRKDAIRLINAPDSHLGYKRLVVASNDRPFIFVLQNVETAFNRSSIFTMIPF